jgi:hypothetical protein
VKKAKVSYSQVEKLVQYLEAEAANNPTQLLASTGNGDRCITYDYQRILATFEELLRLVQ